MPRIRCDNMTEVELADRDCALLSQLVETHRHHLEEELKRLDDLSLRLMARRREPCGAQGEADGWITHQNNTEGRAVK